MATALLTLYGCTIVRNLAYLSTPSTFNVHRWLSRHVDIHCRHNSRKRFNHYSTLSPLIVAFNSLRCLTIRSIDVRSTIAFTETMAFSSIAFTIAPARRSMLHTAIGRSPTIRMIRFGWRKTVNKKIMNIVCSVWAVQSKFPEQFRRTVFIRFSRLPGLACPHNSHKIAGN